MSSILVSMTNTAGSTPFDNTTNGFDSNNVQAAIEEARADAIANDRFLILPSYGGNANAGRYLEIFSAQGSDVSPIFLSVGANILSIVLQTTAATANCSVGIFDLNVSSTVPVYTVTMSGVKRVQLVGAPLASLLPNALLAIRVTSGSINSPTMQLFFSANT